MNRKLSRVIDGHVSWLLILIVLEFLFFGFDSGFHVGLLVGLVAVVVVIIAAFSVFASSMVEKYEKKMDKILELQNHLEDLSYINKIEPEDLVQEIKDQARVSWRGIDVPVSNIDGLLGSLKETVAEKVGIYKREKEFLEINTEPSLVYKICKKIFGVG